LQPDRKVEIVLREAKREEAHNPAHRAASAGDDAEGEVGSHSVAALTQRKPR
jgi:hypothetical protein